ncbi:helix-turn-helix domain-containing protein [Weissella paramesenteroides]|uniref:helix-turn-helix domain-containing protein n=1 Tax=Weissella paramesenteroides TaxID=1249 RepID=UPI00223AE8D3|nr:helix-turn-helix domain-containing protein [Weissella paramesenteroides]MCT0484903.1 XRE family transcriptional regulator [Weissella paramesenteroides]
MKLAKIIDDRLKELNLSYYRLSKISGVPLNTLYSIKNGVRKVLTLRNTIKIFEALELDLNELKKIDWN